MIEKDIETVDEKNTEVFINLDRPRFLRFGHKALKRLSALMGKSLNKSINAKDLDMEQIEKIMYCGLLSDAKEHGEILELEQMEDILDYADSYATILNAMNKALDNAFMETEHQKN